MNVVFMGTPDFAVPALQALIDSPQVTVKAVYTRADAVSSRGKKLMPSPIKVLAQEAGLTVFTPESLKSTEEQLQLQALAPDLLVVVAYGLLLPKAVLEIPLLGIVNLHASLLPRWRGAAPIQRGILAGDQLFGVSLMAIEEGLDTGPYCATVELPYEGETYPQLEAKLAQAGAHLLLDNLDALEQGAAVWTPQEDAASCYAEKILKKELRLNPQDCAEENLRRIKASSPSAPARAQLCNKGVTVLDANAASDASELSVPEGSLQLLNKKLYLGCSYDALELVTLKPDGGKEMPAAAFAAGINGQLKAGQAQWKALD